MDYDCEMLSLYFKEKGYSKEHINYLLNTNPFNLDYIIWEKRRMNSNKTMGLILKRNNIIEPNVCIQEITNNKQNSVCSYLPNNTIFKVCSARESAANIRFDRNLVYLNGIFKNEMNLLHKLEERGIKFITGYCTHDDNVYDNFMNMCSEIEKNIRISYIKEYKNAEQKIAILKR